MRQIDAVWAGGPVLGLRAAIGAGVLAVGWLVLGSVAGDASAAQLEIGDGALRGPHSSTAVVVESIHGDGAGVIPGIATSGADDAPVVAGLSVLSGVEPALQPVLESVEPVSETAAPVLEAVERALDSVEQVLAVMEPVLESVEPVLEPVGVFGTPSESIQMAPEPALAVLCGGGCDPGPAEPPTYVGDFRSTNSPSAVAVAMADPARQAPGPFEPLAPVIPAETVAPGASGGISLPSDVAERGWVPCSPVAHTMPPGDDIPPAAPAFDSDSTPD